MKTFLTNNKFDPNIVQNRLNIENERMLEILIKQQIQYLSRINKFNSSGNDHKTPVLSKSRLSIKYSYSDSQKTWKLLFFLNA